MAKSPSPPPGIDQAIGTLRKRQKIDDASVVHQETIQADAGDALQMFRIVSAANPNGPQHTVILDAAGTEVDATSVVRDLFTITPRVALPFVPPPPITISPATNNLTLNQGDVLSESITVTVPKNTSLPKADVYFLADTTGSMGSTISAVKAGATTILTSLSGMSIDFAFGVGNYKDLPANTPPFFHQVDPTNVAATVTAAINSWSALGGDDYPEGQLFALAKLASKVAWRPGAKRIVVWFGDAPGHDPICPAISGEVSPITEATATAALAGISVIAISVATPGLDDDPKIGANSYVAKCGPPGGLPGQATRIASATGGAFATGIAPANIVNTIISLVTSVVSQINNVHLQPTGGIVPFISSITPAAGYGPLALNVDHSLKFDVVFKGTVPCSDLPQIFAGTLDVVADGVVVAAKKVVITVPPCQPKETFSYSVKFVCGRQREDDCGPVRPGSYETEINIHNYHDIDVRIDKFVLPVVLAGIPIGREPRFVGRKAQDHIVLPPHTATMDDCCRIAQLLYGEALPSLPLTVGFLEIVSPVELAITAVYTATDLRAQTISLEVEQIVGQKHTRGQ